MFNLFHSFPQHLGIGSDLLLAGLFIAVIGILIIPLPPFLLDLLIAFNIALAITILLVAIYLHRAATFSAFPTLLLLTTLLRLALNVSSTRLILLHAQAGDVIQAFGSFVVQGNYAVGLIIFLVITLIQFLVIAKGAERVAEVSARFTLDALPGKQMSLDADLRSGLLNAEQGKQRRRELEEESQFYGAMDGAMKFVKGDAIAGLMIAAVNIVGGLCIGILQHGMSFPDAGQIFILLTVGDGLVSQIPSLILATAAGIVVTRVSSSTQDLSQQIKTQLLSEPKAAILAGLFLGVLGLLPGLPAIPFLVLASVIAGTALLKSNRLSTDLEFAAESQLPYSQPPPFQLPAPISLEVGTDLTPCIDTSTPNGHTLMDRIPQIREDLFSLLGIRVPGIHIRGNINTLKGRRYRIAIDDIPLEEGTIPAEHSFICQSMDVLRHLGFSPSATTPVQGSVLGSWIPDTELDLAHSCGLTIRSAPEFLALHLATILRREVHRFFTVQHTQRILDYAEQSLPALVAEVRKGISILDLTSLYQALLEERISIRDQEKILHVVAHWAPKVNIPSELLGKIRIALSRVITHAFTDEHKELRCIILETGFEDRLLSAVRQTANGNELLPEPGIYEALEQELPRHFPSGRRHVLLTRSKLRPHIRNLLHSAYFRNEDTHCTGYTHVDVLAYQELEGDVLVKPLGILSVNLPLEPDRLPVPIT